MIYTAIMLGKYIILDEIEFNNRLYRTLYQL